MQESTQKTLQQEEKKNYIINYVNCADRQIDHFLAIQQKVKANLETQGELLNTERLSFFFFAQAIIFNNAIIMSQEGQYVKFCGIYYNPDKH